MIHQAAWPHPEIFSLISSTQLHVFSDCAPGWKPYGNKCYLANATDALSWEEAEQACFQQYAHLVTVKDGKNSQLLYEFIFHE